mgnify:CR=1 FL=1
MKCISFRLLPRYLSSLNYFVGRCLSDPSKRLSERHYSPDTKRVDVISDPGTNPELKEIYVGKMTKFVRGLKIFSLSNLVGNAVVLPVVVL